MSRQFFQVLAQGIGQTCLITAGAFAFGAIIAIPLALLRRSTLVWLRWPATTVIEVLRSIPPIVVLFVLFYGLGSGAIRLSTVQAAILGLGVIAAAYLAEIYRAGIDAVATGQWEASKALAVPRSKTYLLVILPQALIVIIPPAATFAIGLLKDSAIASVIGAHDITFQAFQESQATLQGLTIFAIAGGLYILLSIPIAVLARWADHTLSQKAAV